MKREAKFTGVSSGKGCEPHVVDESYCWFWLGHLLGWAAIKSAKLSYGDVMVFYFPFIRNSMLC